MDVQNLLLKYGKPSYVLVGNDRHEMPQLVEVLKQFLRQYGEAFIKGADGLPILRSYSSDCTPVKVKQRITAKLGPTRVHRVGGMSVELLMEVVFLRYVDLDDQCHTHVVLRDPLPLTHGKSGLALFAASRQFFPTARECGHLGLVVEHLVCDRAQLSILDRLLRQQHTLIHAHMSEGPALEEDPQLQCLLNLVVACGCCNHDAHNSLKWALHFYFQDLTLLKDMWICIESLRNAYGLLHQRMGSWLLDRARFTDHTHHPETLRELWTLLGQPPEVVEHLVSLRALFRDEHLEVAAELQNDPDLWDKLTFALLQVMRFQKYSESRWLTIGCSMRTLVASLLLGLSSWSSPGRALGVSPLKVAGLLFLQASLLTSATGSLLKCLPTVAFQCECSS